MTISCQVQKCCSKILTLASNAQASSFQTSTIILSAADYATLPTMQLYQDYYRTCKLTSLFNKVGDSYDISMDHFNSIL